MPHMNTPENWLIKAIQQAVHAQTATIVAEETTKAEATVRDLMGKMIDSIALSIFTRYDVRLDADQILITASKEHLLQSTTLED